MTQIFSNVSLRKSAVDKPINIFPRELFHFLVQGLIKLFKKPHSKILITFFTVIFQRTFRKMALFCDYFDYVKTTNEFETRFSRMFLFIFELWTQFSIVHKNHPRDFHMSLNTPLSKKSRAYGVNDCDLSDNLKEKNRKYPLGYDQTQAFSKIRKIHNMVDV